MITPIAEIFKAPDSIVVKRNGLDIVGTRVSCGIIAASDGLIAAGDSDGLDHFDPIRCIPGTYEVYRYAWIHSARGEINLGVLIINCIGLGGRTGSIRIRQNYAPHITDGIPVDSANITVQSGKFKIAIESGLGDGVYPVHGQKRLLSRWNGIFIDFKLWHVRKIILMGNKSLDKYSIAVENSAQQGDPPEPAAPSR